MYSAPHVAVDKGLGFDFSGIADMVKNAATVGLNVYQQQMQLRQVKAMGVAAQQGGYAMPSAGQYVGLPISQAFAPQPTFPTPAYVPPPSGGMGMGTMLMIGGVLALGGLLFMRAK